MSSDWIVQIASQNWKSFLTGAEMTLYISLIGTVIGSIIGMIIGVVRTIPRGEKGPKKIFLTIKENFGGFLLYIIFASIDFLGMQYLPIIATKWQVLTLPLVSFIAYYLMLLKSDFLAQLSKISTNE